MRHLEPVDFLVKPQTWAGLVGVGLTCGHSVVGSHGIPPFSAMWTGMKEQSATLLKLSAMNLVHDMVKVSNRGFSVVDSMLQNP